MFTKYFPNIPYVKETIVKAIVPLMMYPKMIFLVYFCLLEDLSFGIINKISRGKTFMDTNLIADGKIFKLSFNIGKKLSRLRCGIRLNTLVRNNNILKAISMVLTLIITFIPLIVLYITRIIKIIIIIICGVLYSSCDVIKLQILYKIVAPIINNTMFIKILIINPVFLYRKFIF